jgi:hypothetical protein
VLLVTHTAVQPLQDKLRSAYYQITSGEGDEGDEEDDEEDSDDDNDDDDDEDEDNDGRGSYYSTEALAGLSSRTISSEPSSSGSWGVVEQQETGDDFAQSEIVRGFAHMDAELMKAAMQRYADSLEPSDAETLLAHITEHARAITASGGPNFGPGGSRRGSGIRPLSTLPALAKFPFSYGSQIVSACVPGACLPD